MIGRHKSNKVCSIAVIFWQCFGYFPPSQTLLCEFLKAISLAMPLFPQKKHCFSYFVILESTDISCSSNDFQLFALDSISEIMKKSNRIAEVLVSGSSSASCYEKTSRSPLNDTLFCSASPTMCPSALNVFLTSFI